MLNSRFNFHPTMKKPIYLSPIYLSTVLLLFFTGSASLAQEVSNDFQTRTEVMISWKALDKITLSLTPELRMDKAFQVDKYLLESDVSYTPVKGLSLGGTYRFVINPRNNNPTEYLHRFALDATYEHKIKRWEPSLRIKYTNYTEDISQGEFLRYRARLVYDIKNSKITPLLAAEAFHDLVDNQMHKMRYTAGARYRINKNNRIELRYILDYYLQEYQNKHIINLRYRYKF